MTRKIEIEAALDRSLAGQVKVPKLDRRFDAAVWARIEAAEARTTNSVPDRAMSRSPARWLLISNIVGVTVTVLLVAIFGLQSFSGVTVNVPAVEVPVAMADQILKFAAPAISVVSLVFGMLFTPIGRRLRAEFT